MAALSALGLASCLGDSNIYVTSDQVPTNQIFATVQVVEDGGDQVFVEAQLTRNLPPRQPGNRDVFVSLTEADQLWLSIGPHYSQLDMGGDIYRELQRLNETQKKLEPTREQHFSFLFGRVSVQGDRYVARLPRNPDGQYQVALLRQGNTDAPESSARVPESFSIQAPRAGDLYSRSNDYIQIDWSPVEANTPVTIEVRTSCVNDSFSTVTETLSGDDGSVTLEPGALASDDLDGACASTISVIKSRLGNFDSAFTGGYVAGYQVRSVAINTSD